MAIKTLATLLDKYERALGMKNVKHIPTGLLPLDYVLDGGVPCGKIIEIYGENGTGKTTLAIFILSRMLQKVKDKAVVYVDAEYSFDSNWAVKNGVNVEEAMKNEKLFVLYPNSMDEAFDAIIDTAKSNESSLIILDSLPALAPAELYKDEDPTNFSRPGLSAKKQTNFIELITPIIEKSGTTLLVINQVRANISPYGASTTVPGAYAYKHMVAVRLELKRKDFYGTKEQPAGIITQVKCLKNKTGIPFRTENLIITTANGLSVLETNVEFMINNDLLEHNGAFYIINNQKLHGRQAVIDYLKENVNLYEQILEDYVKNINS